MREKVAVSWSGGKDCTLALYKVITSGQLDVHSLHTTFNEETKRVGLHGVRQELIEQQAFSIHIPLDKIPVPASENHNAYEAAMNSYYQSLAEKGIRRVVFGDIFLEDLKVYREKMLASQGLKGIFPLWKQNSKSVAESFFASGFKAVICAADSNYFEENSVGAEYNSSFLNALHPDVDPCGENGEFHTFVYDGPIFKNPVSFQQRQVVSGEYAYNVNLPNGQSEVRKSNFWFRELE